MNSTTRSLSSCTHVLAACLAALATVFSTGDARAENSIRVGYAEANAGATGVHVIVTARNDVPVHGYSLAVTFPPQALRVVEFGVCGTHVAASVPDLVAPIVDNELGFATLGVIVEFTAPTGNEFLPPVLEGETSRIIARLTFDVLPDAHGGLYPIRLVDGVGSPAVSNRFTYAGTTFIPELEHGAFFVGGEDVLMLEGRQAFCGATAQVTVRALAQHPEPISGYSIGVSYDCDLLRLDPTEVRIGMDVTRAIGADNIEFFQTDVDTIPGPLGCRSRSAVIFDSIPPFDENRLLPASVSSPPSQELMRYVFRPINAAINCATTQRIDLLLEEIDAPAVLNNAFVVGGESVTPRLFDGKIFFCTGSLRGRVVNALTRLPLAGVRVFLEPAFLSVTTGGAGTFAFSTIPPGGYTLRLTRDGFYSDVVEDIDVRCDPTVNDTGDLLLFEQPQGECRGTGSDLYETGKVNDDDRTDLSDAVFMFVHLFRGGPPPRCVRAADINGDTRFDISDGIALLNFLFRGEAPPVEPFGECGAGPPDHPLPCESHFACG